MRRRSFLTLLGAAAVAPLLPAEAAAPAALVPSPAPSAPAVAAARKEFGFRVGALDDLWQTGYDSRDQALREAMAYQPSGTIIEIAEVGYYPVYAPDRPVEDLLNGLADDEHPADSLLSSLAGWNEEGDYDGCFACACEDEDTAEAHGPAINVLVVEALERAGRGQLAALMDQPAALYEALGDDGCAALEADQALADGLKALLEQIGALYADLLNGLIITDRSEHTVPLPTFEPSPGAVPAGAEVGGEAGRISLAAYLGTGGQSTGRGFKGGPNRAVAETAGAIHHGGVTRTHGERDVRGNRAHAIGATARRVPPASAQPHLDTGNPGAYPFGMGAGARPVGGGGGTQEEVRRAGGHNHRWRSRSRIGSSGAPHAFGHHCDYAGGRGELSPIAPVILLQRLDVRSHGIGVRVVQGVHLARTDQPVLLGDAARRRLVPGRRGGSRRHRHLRRRRRAQEGQEGTAAHQAAAFGLCASMKATTRLTTRLRGSRPARRFRTKFGSPTASSPKREAAVPVACR